ncbi:right-handed parallel beta-helix repeat-containing protein [Mycolicibacterium vaccae]|nr:right-handed parallel beta-helix repeat-containing protein [Mycolicibacterium vaccae]
MIIDQAGSHNNWVRNNTIGPVIRHGILIQEYAHHNLIEHNTITGAVSGAIDLHGEDEYSNAIRYNTVSDCVRNGTSVSPNGAGIEIGEYSGVVGTDKLHDNSGPNNWIHHNIVYNCTCGLRIVNNSNNTWIEDNIFYDNLEAGIKADLAPLEDLFIRRNTIYGNGSGILLNDVRGAVLEDNKVTDNRKYGIWTNGGVTGYLIAGNTVVSNGTDVVLASPNGVYLP